MQLVITSPTSSPSLWRRLDVRCLLATGLAIGLTPFFLNTLLGAGVALLLAVVLLASARPHWPALASRLTGVSVFLLLVVVFLPWTLGPPYWEWGPLRLSLVGLHLGLLIVLRATTMVIVVAWLLAVRPVEDLLLAAQKMGVPRFVTSLLLLTHRYLHLFLDELNLLRITLRTRAYRNRPARQSYRTIGHVAGALLVRSYERAERVDQAMRCRGFDGRLHALRTWRLSWRDPCWGLGLMLVGAVPLAIDLWARTKS